MKMNRKSIKTYSDLIKIPSYEDRFEYLKLSGSIGSETFGFDRYLNQTLYKSKEWRSIRDKVIIRDDGCDMGVSDYPINGRVYIHHINPLTEDDLLDRSPMIFDMENLICVSHDTHNAIHFGDASLLLIIPIERSPGDTCPWR